MHAQSHATSPYVISHVVRVPHPARVALLQQARSGLTWPSAAGGGTNHRQGLFDMVMIKDNHVTAAGGITAAVRQTEVRCRSSSTPRLLCGICVYLNGQICCSRSILSHSWPIRAAHEARCNNKRALQQPYDCCGLECCHVMPCHAMWRQQPIAGSCANDRRTEQATLQQVFKSGASTRWRRLHAAGISG